MVVFGRYAIVLALAMLFVVGVCASAFAQTEDDIAAINELYSQATLACATGDLELYLSRFTEDVVAMPPGVPASIGVAESRAALEGLFGAYDLELPYTVQDVVVPGDWAFARSTFAYSMTPKEGGETATLIGKELDMFRKQADGSWKLHIESYNFDAPPPAAKLAGAARGPRVAKRAQTEDDIAAIDEVFSQAAQVVGAGDVEAYLSLFTEDAVVMAPDFPAMVGKGELRSTFEGIFGLFDLGLPYIVDEVGGSGDWAFARTHFQYSMTPKAGGETTTSPGKELDILQRQADGSWRIYLESWSYDAPPSATSVEASSWGQVKALPQK